MRILILLASFILCHASKAQKSVYFPGFELINMEQASGLQYATSKLLKSYIEDNHPFTITLPEEIGNGYIEKETLDQSITRAVEIDAKYVLRGEIHQLQGLYILSLAVYETRNREQVWHDMAKGLFEEDLDPLLSRLGRSFFTKRTAKTDIEIDEVTSYDQTGIALSQIQVNHYAGILLGGKYIRNETTLSGFGLAYTYDASSLLFNLNFELYPSSNTLSETQLLQRKLQHGNINLGLTLPFSRKKTTVFLDAGMEYGYHRIKETINESVFAETQSGLGLYTGIGCLFNRNATVNFRLFSSISIPLYEIDNQNLSGIRFGIVTSFSK